MCTSYSGQNDACVIPLWTASWGLQPNTPNATMSARVVRWICMSSSLFFLSDWGCHTFVLHLLLCHWAQLQCVLRLERCLCHSLGCCMRASTQPSMLPCQLGLRPVQDCVWGSPFLSFLLAFRCLNVWTSPTCLCVEHRIIFWIIVVQLVTLRRETKKFSHSAVMLTSLYYSYF